MQIITRAEAKEKGLKRYFTGKPCKYGHISERLIGNGGCFECRKKIQKKYYNKNIDKIETYRKENADKTKIYRKNYYKKNKKIISENCKKYYDNNKDILIEKNKEYYKENSEAIKKRIKIYKKIYSKTLKYKVSAQNYTHKRRETYSSSDVTNRQLLELRETQTHCYWCGTPLKNKVSHVDHYIPLSKGGKHTISNLVMACASCNLSKGAKMPEEFALQKGRLL